MDDLTEDRLRALTATLPPPEVLLSHITTRRAMRRSFLVRADAWAANRDDGEPNEVVYPRDAVAIAALGVPCPDCLGLVHRDGEDGHRIDFHAAAGQHWAALIVAHCGRRPA